MIWIKRALILLGVVFACLPAAFVVTLLLLPLWKWVEQTYGIESVGHSGPAEWCFWVVYGVLGVAGLGLWRWIAKGAAT